MDYPIFREEIMEKLEWFKWRGVEIIATNVHGERSLIMKKEEDSLSIGISFDQWCAISALLNNLKGVEQKEIPQPEPAKVK